MLIRKGAMEGIKLIDNHAPLICDSCEHAKSMHKPIQKECKALLAKAFSVEVRSDFWGPSPTLSLGGRKYYIMFTDNHTHFTRLTILFTKDGTLDMYKGFAAWASTQHSMRIKHLHSDHGGEYTGSEFSQFLKEQGTERHLTTHNTLQHNRVMESLNRCLVEQVHALLHQSGLPNTLWAEALHFIIWVKNHTLTKVLSNVTPFKKLTGAKPNLAGVPEWGQCIWVYTSINNKLGTCANIMHWVSFDADSTHTHCIYWADKQKISVKHDIKFTVGHSIISIPSIPLSLSPPALTIHVPIILMSSTSTSTPTQVISTP